MRPHIRALLAVLATAFSIQGCVSSGRDIDTSKMASFQKGITTRQQVLAALGPPNTTVVNTNGTVAIGYSSVHAHANPAMFIPIVGILATGATAHGQHVIFLFKDEILVSWTTSETNVQSGIGSYDSTTQIQSNAAPPQRPSPTPMPPPQASTAPAQNTPQTSSGSSNRRQHCTTTDSGAEWC